ncbi:MAG TPA: glycosyltransferase family 39 protein [Rhizomicrobium sp.]|nr:glycosyltransferase family 39 protein [Rhizomicrobium sp.]
MQERRRLFFWAFAIVALVTLVRVAVLVVSPLELYPDEAQYWWWAQTPDLGYFSKPPLIAWIIWATTSLFGDSEWAIRIGMPLLHGGAALLLFAIGRASFPRSPMIAFWSALAYLTLPGVSYSAGLASTDAPLLFFWALALLAFIRGVQTNAWPWALLCGVALGFGILAKYAMLFFAVSAPLAAFAKPEIRKFVLGRGGLLAAAVAGVIVAPNIVWNTSHHFATLAHTETNADWMRARFSLLHLAEFLAGQFGVFGPVLMAAWLAALWRLGRGGARTTEEAALVAFSAVPLLLIAAQSFVAEANANWAATAFVAAVPLALDQILRFWPRPALPASFALHGLVLALLWLVLIWPPAAERLGVGNVFKRQEGWRALAGVVSGEFAHGGYSAIATDNRSVTAELLYYLRPRGLPVRIWDPDLANHNHFEMTMRLTAPAPHTLLVVEPENETQVLSTFESKRLVTRVAAPVGGRHVRVMDLYEASFYRGPADLNAAQSR